MRHVDHIRPLRRDQAQQARQLARPVGGLLGKIYVDVKIRVRDESDYGLQTIINNLPKSQTGLPIQIRSLSLTLDGALPNGNSFMVNPTTCTTATTKVTADSYASSRPVTATGSFTPTDCANEPFQPGMQIGIDQPTPDTITPHSIALDAQGNVYVAELGNKRIQVFDGEGTPKKQITGVGTPRAILAASPSAWKPPIASEPWPTA